MNRQPAIPATRPVETLSSRYPAGFVDPPHAHARAQFCTSISGVMTMTTEAAAFRLPPGRAMWVPAGLRHQFTCREPVTFQAVYVDPVLPAAAQDCRVIELTPLTQALMDEVAGFAPGYDEDGREGRLVALLLDEVARMPDQAARVPVPADPRLRRVCEAILAEPADRRDLNDWARMAGMGRRTFTRIFHQQTGMGLATWRQQVRVMEALSLLAQGRPVTSIAFEVGYDSPSAFTSMFRRTVGQPPSAYARS